MSKRLELIPFSAPDNPLKRVEGDGHQAGYVLSYLDELGATTVLRESRYFDRDYLAEFAAFYGVSAHGYSNTCERLHFFAGSKVTRQHLVSAASGNRRVLGRLQKDYLGFVVLRPIPSARFGRTALRWYPDKTPATPRMTNPSREYTCHVAGITLKVHSIAWQQQDTGVGACATVALWTMLHSSAFDDHHAIPTTADITRHAHRTASLGSRVFPSTGLTIYQVCEAIKECGLAPVVIEGDLGAPGDKRFSRVKFAPLCASLVRSGYPVMVLGMLKGIGRHAACVVGFRESAAPLAAAGKIELQDESIEYVYTHDDNIGPSGRFRIELNSDNSVSLITSPPGYVKAAAIPYPAFCPSHLVAAVHDDLRTSPDTLHVRVLEIAQQLSMAYDILRNHGAVQGPAQGFAVSTRFAKLHDYLDSGLSAVLGNDTRALGATRLALCEQVPAMSLHIGIGRIGLGNVVLLDVLFDTTDSDRQLPCFCHVAFDPVILGIVKHLKQSNILDLGAAVRAH